MRISIAAMIILFLSWSMCAQEPKTVKNTMNITAGINFAYDSIACKVGEKEVENHFTFLYSTIECSLELFDYFNVGLMAGYQFSYMKDSVDFIQLPLSLSMDHKDTKFSGLLVGANIQYLPITTDNFSLKLRGDFLYSFRLSQDYTIEWEDSSIESGSTTIKQDFWLANFDLLFQYEGLSGITLFAGGRFNLLKGKYNAVEAIKDLNGTEDVRIKQKNLAGPVAGVVFELGSSWEITLKASLISRFSANLSVHYVF